MINKLLNIINKVKLQTIVLMVIVMLTVIVSIKYLGEDNFYEEYIEKLIKRTYNIDIDFSPTSEESIL